MCELNIRRTKSIKASNDLPRSGLALGRGRTLNIVAGMVSFFYILVVGFGVALRKGDVAWMILIHSGRVSEGAA